MKKFPKLLREFTGSYIELRRIYQMSRNFTANATKQGDRWNISVEAPEVWERILFEPRKLITLFSGFEIHLELIIDGEAFSVAQDNFDIFMLQLDDIINDRLYCIGTQKNK